MRRVAALAAVAFVLMPAAARAAVLRAETVLPPGQSGFVSIPGVADGTGSPHLHDQTPLFPAFKWKAASFGQPGTSEAPKPGVTITRDQYGVPRIDAQNEIDM